MRNAQLALRLAFSAGRTRIVEQHQTAPLKVTRAFERQIASRPGAEICVMDASPGLLDGDDYHQSFALEPDTAAWITTQGFTRVHPCAEQPAQQQIQLEVADGARLFYLPEATILFKDAAFHATLNAQVEPGGTLIGLDLLGAGRIARGECFEFQEYTSKLQVRNGDQWALCAQTRIEPARLEPRHMAAWGQWTHWGTLYGISREIDGRWLDAARDVLREFAGPMECRGAASLLPAGGIGVSILARRAHDARALAIRIVAAWEILII